MTKSGPIGGGGSMETNYKERRGTAKRSTKRGAARSRIVRRVERREGVVNNIELFWWERKDSSICSENERTGNATRKV